MSMRLQELQNKDKYTCRFKVKQLVKNNWQNIDDVLYYQGFPYVLKIIQIELISRHHNNLLIGYFGMKKTYELIAQKYY